MRRRPVLWSLAVLGLLAGAAVAGVVIRQDVATSAAAVTPDVIFASGENYTAINSAGFATITLGTSATSATATINGVPGAADLQLNGVLNLTNQDASQAYDITLKRSTALDAAISEFTVHVKTSAGATVVDYDASAAASSAQFNLPVSTTYDISIDYTIADGTAVGALGAFDLQLEMVPA